MSLPPKEIPLGAMRFNSDSQKLEYFDGETWFQINTFSPNLNGGSRGVAGGGNTGSYVNTIDYWCIPTQGNAVDFGDRTVSSYCEGCASNTRGLFGGGHSPTYLNTVDYITISSTGNATDFGDITEELGEGGAGSNQIRGIWAGGYSTSPNAQRNNISYVTIASTGNGKDFGDLTGARTGTWGNASPTIYLSSAGQQDGGNSHDNIIDFVYIASTGNAMDFGDITSNYLVNGAAAGSATRSVNMGGGIAGPTYAAQSIMDYVTFSTRGNATGFGDLRVACKHHNATSDSVRAMIAGGSSSDTDLIQYITVSTEGGSVDFGNLTSGRYGAGVCSNGHGGLG